MHKLVLDTNTIVSAFFWEGNEAKLLRKIEEGQAELYVTEEILREIEEVINRSKFRESLNKVNMTSDDIMKKIVSLAHLVLGKKYGINICRDKKDNMLLECAKSAGAGYIISGDKDLLVLKKFENIQIIRASEIIEKI